jgi:multicomponent Na+:H+ antiporter subunit G
MIGEVIVLGGAVLTLLAAIGVVRFPDALTRMHALTKASTVGFGLIAIGSCLNMTNANDITSVLLAAGLQLLTLPVAATLIARSTYWARRIPVEFDGEDELRRAAETGRLGRPTLRRDAAATEGGSDRSET